ncbi:hypothetical protein [Pantoea sp. 1B4]|uniref:hypothetical protein n=1 Tax=Pantoea sp. 1B4 TaxID=2804760 RepID=UPI001AA75B6A|nr:hypothetical protein [Pantoea sp. 1B4]MBN1087560.1 hypothetical protein [Pantoea sp. 1B4]MCX2194077.1 hypothetical protein [Pantoea agglomerans]
MSAQEAKIRHQREYQDRVEAVRNGQAPGRVLEKRPQGIVPAKKWTQPRIFLMSRRAEISQVVK